VINKISKRQHGFATLESALIVTALMAICFGILGLLDYLKRTNDTYKSIVREIHNSTVRSNIIRENTQQGGYSLEINTQALQEFIDDTATKILSNGTEVGYSIADIDPTTGALQGVRPVGYRAARGANNPRQTAECPGLESEIVRFSAAFAQQVPSNFAVPDGGTSQIRYLPTAILVAARAEIDFSDATFTRNQITLIGMNPRVTMCAVSVLRGEVGGN